MVDLETATRPDRSPVAAAAVTAPDRATEPLLGPAGGRITGRGVPVESREDLARIDQPGAIRLAARVAADPTTADDLTGRRNRVAVVTDGSAVQGLGQVGPVAALPVIEGRCALLARLAGIDAVPLCLSLRSVDDLVATIIALAPGFGAIDLAEIAAPTCFEVTRRLRHALRIPVFHDRQHGVPIVVLAGLRNALKAVHKQLETARLVVLGTGPAGTATARLLVTAGAGDVVLVGRHGVLHPDDFARMPAHQARLMGWINPRRIRGGLAEALEGADAVIGLSAGGVLTRDLVASMGPSPVVFALASPEPEIRPELIEDVAAVVATSRPDHPNPVNSMLASPGVLRGLLNARATQLTVAMQLAAADVLAGLVPRELVAANRLLPGLLDEQVVATVSAAVAAMEAGRRREGTDA